MSDRSVLEFWYEFASTYSYLSAMRIEALADTAGVTVLWRPFLLGPIFAAQGLATSPFNLFPVKGRHMWRDVAREADLLGLPFVRPDPFPQNGLLAARIAYAGMTEGWCPHFTRAVFRAEFGEGRPIDDASMLRDILRDLGLGPDIAASCGHIDVKDGLRRQTERAADLGVFGAPAFTTVDGELFWGNDRLERALGWAGALPVRCEESIRLPPHRP